MGEATAAVRSFFGTLALVFITLRLVGAISWPWVWVLAPLWVPALLAVVVVLAVTLWALATD